jgi:hypothetical protein
MIGMKKNYSLEKGIQKAIKVNKSDFTNKIIKKKLIR